MCRFFSKYSRERSLVIAPIYTVPTRIHFVTITSWPPDSELFPSVRGQGLYLLLLNCFSSQRLRSLTLSADAIPGAWAAHVQTPLVGAE